MAAPSSSDEGRSASELPVRLTRIIIRLIVGTLVTAALLFAAAARSDWVAGWVYLGLWIAGSWTNAVLLWRKNPELLAERIKFTSGDVKPWDKILAPILAIVGPVTVWMTAGLDVRLGWTGGVHPAAQSIGFIILVAAYLLSSWALGSNKFFSSVVRIQRDRGHTVVTDGPYRFVRHPGYVGGIISYLATPLALGSLWAFLPAAAVIIVGILRTALEDRTLQEELEGYADYVRHVRYRLLPGVW